MSNLDLRNIEKLSIDFEEIMEGLVNRIKTNLPDKWKDFLISNFGMEILEAFAYEATMMFYYNNMSVNECFLPTAKTRTAVYNHAKSMGYKPSPATQSSVTLKFYLDNVHENNILIPKYTICTSGNVNFYTTENAVLYSNELYVTVSAKSGNINNDSFISNGIVGYKYKLINNNVNKVESVFVDDVEYSFVDFIDSKNSNAMYYTVDYDSDYYAYIKFGDGVYGMNPSKNLKIDVTYITDSDITHNVNPYTINNINDVIYDSTNVIINNINVTNDEYANGASDAETLDEIKRNVPTIYKTQKRCVTRQDYEDIALMINGVNKVKILDNTLIPEIGIFGVKVCVIPDAPVFGGYPSESFKRDILQIFNDRKICATQVEVIDPSYITLNTTINVKISPTASGSVISNKIRTAISNYLSWSNRDFGQLVQKQEVYSLVANIPGILSIEDIDIEEQRYIYVLEAPEIGSNVIKIRDNMAILQEGSHINIMNVNGESVLIAKILTMDNDGNCSLVSLSDNSNIVITNEMNISSNCWVYPVIKTKGSYKYGSKVITINTGSTSNVSDVDNKSLMLSKLNYTSIYFGDDITTQYQILFRVGESLYLDRGLETDIDNNTDVVVMYKKFIPILNSTAIMGSSSIELTSYPRFGVGAKLLRYASVTHTDTTLTIFRNSSGVDYLDNYIAIDTLVKINRVYINASNVLTEGVDYNLINNNIISWTDVGKTKVYSNSQYYVDITKKSDAQNVKSIDYYVKGINKKTISISPSIDSTLADGTSFDYTTDTFNILPWEIADCGIITVNIEV